MEAKEPQIPAVAASLTGTLLLALYLSAPLMTSSSLLIVSSLPLPSLQSSFSFQSGALGLAGWSGIILYLFTRSIRSVTQSDPGHHNSFVTQPINVSPLLSWLLYNKLIDWSNSYDTSHISTVDVPIQSIFLFYLRSKIWRWLDYLSNCRDRVDNSFPVSGLDPYLSCCQSGGRVVSQVFCLPEDYRKDVLPSCKSTRVWT